MNTYFDSSRTKRINLLLKIIAKIPIIISIISVLAFLYDFGFYHSILDDVVLKVIYLSALIVGILSIVIRYFFQQYRPRLKGLPIDFIIFTFLVIVAYKNIWGLDSTTLLILKRKLFLYCAVFLVFFRELSSIRFEFKRAALNPAQLFAISFLLIIIFGTFMLLLPKATYTSISFIDAVFTSTSAVCVTGLVVVDTGSFFTQFGQLLIAVLIQVGGLGIMTFASYFTYFFRGGATYENQLLLRDMTNTEKISEVFSVLKKIILITFLIEGLGSVIIFYCIDTETIPLLWDRIFFSAFHAISGFCNAGFSTLPNSFYQDTFQLNYPLHLTVAALFILGGLGFPIVFNLYRFVKTKFKVWIFFLLRHKHKAVSPRLINMNTRIVLVTSLILTIAGTVAFFVLEYNNTLANHSLVGKLVTSFFGAVTTRTAGFNSVDTAALGIHTILVVLFLMWVGASPASTGGGIKTSTLAVAFLNIVSIVRGKSRLELFNREIPAISVNRAFAIITLSIIVISISTVCISFFEPSLSLLNISFECVSAYSTVGLSRGITAQLCTASKLVLIITMFIGRVGTLTLLIAIFKKGVNEVYRLPSENILIN